MRFTIIAIFILASVILHAQNSLDNIFNSDCVEIQSDTTIFSEFHQFGIRVPEGWIGKLEVDNPVPSWKIKNMQNNGSITITQSFDAAEVFEWAKANLDSTEYQIVEIKNNWILVENGKNGKPYWLTIADKKESNGTWVWRMRLGLSEEKNEEVNCGLSFIINQMIK